MRTVFRLLVLPGAALLAACDLSPNLSGSEPGERRESAGPDRFHLKTFSWDPASPLAKSGYEGHARSTRFESIEALGKAFEAMQRELRAAGASDSLWKPLNHSCPEFELALWNRYGEIRVRDSLFLDEALLRARCLPLSVPEEGGEALGKSAAYASGEAQHRVYPYKMIGRVWSDRDLILLRSSGAETQFKKEREYFGVMGWWDTDAARIGVRIYLLDCGGNPKVCYSGGEKSNWHRNASSAWQTDFSDWGETRVQTTGLPPGIKRLNLKVSEAAIALHSADHAGIRFRAVSTSGILASTPLLAMPATEYVTW
jgi:hypothetical protein